MYLESHVLPVAGGAMVRSGVAPTADLQSTSEIFPFGPGGDFGQMIGLSFFGIFKTWNLKTGEKRT